ncbi:MAG: sulfite exporter TauE/SafE family protein [Coriobacteriia bacterium]|nr:sulfite exporter TauE/SafE family protein [Coriobacteriia bacterium]
MAIPIAIFLTGALAQLVDGALGMGFGVSAMSLLTTLGLAPAIVSAVVHVAKIATGISSGLAHLRFGNVDQRVTLVLSLSGSVGAVIGATMLLSLAAGMVRPFVAAALLLLGLRVFAKFFAARAAAPDSGLPCATSRGAKASTA